MNTNQYDKELWSDLCVAENAFYEARMTLISSAQNITILVSAALAQPSQRGTALRLLQILPEGLIRHHFSQLVDLVSVGHSDIELSRAVLLRIDRDWLVQNIDPYVMQILENGGEEEFRRIAEFYKILSSDLLSLHLERCSLHIDPEINEIASDFEDLVTKNSG